MYRRHRHESVIDQCRAESAEKGYEVGVILRALGLTLISASILAAQQPATSVRHPKTNPFSWIRRTAKAEVNLAERFSAWGISDEPNQQGCQTPTDKKDSKCCSG
jgi:hypothetical protein